MTEQTATFTTPNASNGRNYGQEKETIDTFILIGVGKSRSDIHEVATLRIYMGRSRNASVKYASLWVHGGPKGVHVSGTGRAGGYGYCKSSAAAAAAFDSAGIKLAKSISGVGIGAIEDAMKAVGIACGYDTVRVIRA